MAISHKKTETEKTNTGLSFEIVEQIGRLSEPNEKGWAKELNKVAWNGRDAKYDIRDWNSDHTKCGKGITLSDAEAQGLFDTLKK